MWINIICDLEQPLSYLLPAIVIATMGLGVYKMWRKEKVKIVPASVLLIIYIEILMQTAFFSREPGSRKQIELNLFGTWGETSVAHAYFVENIIMFIPFGVLVPMVFKQMQKMRICVLVGFLFSCVIEISQLITRRGFCQLDDIVTNTAGTMLGWLIWKLLDKIIHKK